MSVYNIMFVGKFFRKHQKKILILLVVLVALFLLNRQFRIFEGVENNRTVTIRPPPRLPRVPIGSTGSSTGLSTSSSTNAPTNVSGSTRQMTAAEKHMCGIVPNAPACKPNSV
jgi:hypothetical protein